MKEFSLLHREESQRVPGYKVAEHYHNLSPGGDKKIPELVEKFQVWKLKKLDSEDFRNAQFWYSDNISQDHPDHFLTDKGRFTDLKDITQRWGLAIQLYPDHKYIGNVNFFLECYQNKTALPHAIFIEGRIKKSHPYIIDGNTRCLAGAIHLNKTGQLPNLSAYIGRKPLLKK